MDFAGSSDFLRALINSSQDAILVADASTGVIVYANPAANKLFECDPAYIIGLHQTKLHPVDELEYVQNQFVKFVSSDKYSEVRAHILTQSGKVKPVLISGSKIFESDGKKYISAYFKDITYIKHLDEIAFEQSHVVRRPVANILGLSDLLLEHDIHKKERNELISAIRTEAMDLDQIIRKISIKTVL